MRRLSSDASNQQQGTSIGFPLDKRSAIPQSEVPTYSGQLTRDGLISRSCNRTLTLSLSAPFSSPSCSRKAGPDGPGTCGIRHTEGKCVHYMTTWPDAPPQAQIPMFLPPFLTPHQHGSIMGCH